MSVTYFLLLLLFISLHACKAHPLGKKKKTYLFPKNEGENGFEDSSAMKLGKKNDRVKGTKPEFVAHIKKPKERKNFEKFKKLREANPKHVLEDYDYPPPDVHPPSHNSPDYDYPSPDVHPPSHNSP